MATPATLLCVVPVSAGTLQYNGSVVTLKDIVMRNPVMVFVCRFIVLFLFFHGLNYTLIGLAIPGGYYNEWIANYFNYAPAFRLLLLEGAAFVVRLSGFRYYTDAGSLHIPGFTIHVAFACLGFGLMFFHWAFVIAYPLALKRKLLFLVVGTCSIIILNILRIGGLAMIFSARAFNFRIIDHHTVFNFVVYAFLFLLIRQMIRGEKRFGT